jgi:hypothetical protein
LDPAGTPWAPKWLVDAVGIDSFASVVSVRHLTASSDGDLARIGSLSRLQAIEEHFNIIRHERV